MTDKKEGEAEKILKEEIQKLLLKIDSEKTRLKERLRSLDAPVMKTHPGELDSTYTNEASGNGKRIETINHAIERCYDALERLRMNRYGICKECEYPIDLKRLKSVPFTEHCAGCKTEKEAEIKRQTPPGVPRQTSVSCNTH